VVDLKFEELLSIIDKGRVRGYDEIRVIDNIRYFYQFAIKKEKEKYFTYFFYIPESKMDTAEEYDDNEEVRDFSVIKEAISYLINKGAKIEKFTGFKGVKPF